MSSCNVLQKNEEDIDEPLPEESIELKKSAKVSFHILSVLIILVIIGAKIFLFFFDLVIPRELRDYVPFFQMVRTSTFTASQIMAGKKSRDVMKVSNELDELVLKQQKIKKNYPLRRGIGQAVSMGISPIILIVIPTVIWGEGIVAMIKNWLITYPSLASRTKLIRIISCGCSCPPIRVLLHNNHFKPFCSSAELENLDFIDPSTRVARSGYPCCPFCTRANILHSMGPSGIEPDTPALSARCSSN